MRHKKQRTSAAVSFLAAVIFYALGLSGILSTNILRYLMQIFLYATLGEAWTLLSGFAGMTSLGQQLYIGLSGYSVAIATSMYGWPPLAGVVAGVLVSALAALALSPVLFRMRGMYFAIATWMAAEAAEKIFLNWKFVGQGSGITVKCAPYPQTLDIYLMALTACCLAVILINKILYSRLGMGLMAMRDDPEAAASIGVSLTRTRLAVYVLAAMISALAGGIFIVNKGTIYPDSGFSSGWTVSAVLVSIIGGTGNVWGPVFGSVLYVLLHEYLAHYPGWSNIFLGIITILVIFFMPRGLAGTLENWRKTRIKIDGQSGI